MSAASCARAISAGGARTVLREEEHRRRAQLRAEDKAITEIVKFQQDVGLQSITDGEFRRTYFHIDFLEQLGGVKTDIPVTVKKPDGTEELAPPVIRVIDKVRHEGHPAGRLRIPEEPDRRRDDAQGDHPSPTMLHFRGGRAGISREAYPSSTRCSTTTSPRPTATSCRAWPTPAAATCRWTTPTWPTCATRRCARRRAARRRPQRAAAPLRQVHQQGGGAQALGMTLAMHPCRAIQEHLRRPGQLRAGGRGAAVGDEPRRLLPGIRRRPLGRLPPAALPAQGQDRRAGPGHHQFGQLEKKDDPSAASTRRAIRPARAVGLSPQMRLLQHRARQQHRGGRPAQKLALRETAREVWG